jgi:uncharacterized membrane protein (DUF4010 family)
MFALVATLSQLIIILAVISPDVAFTTFIPIGILITLCSLVGIYFAYRTRHIDAPPLETNPLRLRSAFKLGFALIFLIMIVDITERAFGNIGAQFITFIGALFELHGVAIASANLFDNNQVSLAVVQNSILIAVSASFVSKIFIVAFVARSRFRIIILITLIILLALSIGFLFW